ncbi:MAG TPA: MaoC/PaaZ C-terminal domain-containing protein [Acidimicrobiia bacterium]|nr:MaoC/PaaZ C-terminal domain-containing protein [Acidimicrobiia bacterium]
MASSLGPGVIVGARRGPFDACLDAGLVRRYAAATRDPSPRAQSGDAVPPVAIVTQIWEAQNRGRAAAVPEALQRAAAGGVHGEHDVLLHRPIVPGEPLHIWVEGHGARPAGRNSLVTLRYTALDTGGAVVVEQWWTTVYLGVTCDPAGDPAPEHTLPDDGRERPIGTYTTEVDADMARRYADVSGDWSGHHFDLDAARRSGFDRLFLHGLCTMALCAQGVVELVAGGDPNRVRRVAVRFATPTFLGERLHVHLYDAGTLGYAFEADSAGATVIAHGRAEVR